MRYAVQHMRKTGLLDDLVSKDKYSLYQIDEDGNFRMYNFKKRKWDEWICYQSFIWIPKTEKVNTWNKEITKAELFAYLL